MNDDDATGAAAGDPPDVTSSADRAEGATDSHELLADLADDFARRYRRGEYPSVSEYAKAHPALAEQIRDLFPAMMVMERGVHDAAAVSPTPSEATGATIGRYKLLERIGEGGFGVVFMAEQQRPVRRKVALKVIKPGMDTNHVIARFEAERQALAMMDHPNIAKVFDAGATDSGRPYFVMELVPGVPLIEYCESANLAPRERLELFVQVCDAVQHAHTKGIIHRDLKPTNVLVMTRDDRPVPKVIDFGVAKATGEQLTERTLFTHFAQMLGTPLYMSPEQAQMGGVDVDTRSDVYSLGVILYELLTGTTPFDGQRLGAAALDEVRRIIREEQPPKPSTRLSTAAHLPALPAGRGPELRRLSGMVRGELDWIVMKAIDKDRGRRYESAGGLARDVQRYLRDEAVQACPPTSAYRLRKFALRHRAGVLAAGVLIVALLGGVTGTTRGMVRARKAESGAHVDRQRAEHERDAAMAANKETFGALIELTEFTDRNLLIDGRVFSQSERELLQRMSERYERLAATLPRSAEGLEMRTRSLTQAAQEYKQLGDASRSLDAWRRALEVGNPEGVERTGGQSAVDRDRLRVQARRCRSVALAAEQMQRWPDATEFSRQQLRFASGAVVPGTPVDVELFNLLLTGNWSLTISLTASGDFEQAHAAWQELLRIIAWSDPYPLNGGGCEHLGRIAVRLASAGTPTDPAAVLAPGLAQRQARLSANPQEADTRTQLRQGYRVLGLVLEKSRKYGEALDAFEHVIAVGGVARDGQSPDSVNERSLIFGAVIGRAVCLDALGRSAEAEIAWEAVYVLSGRDAAGWSLTRMVQLARNGQWERAAQLADATLSTRDSAARYDAACIYATASAFAGLGKDSKEALARRAVVLLDEANAAGLFNDPAQAAHLKTDSDLNPVRARSDFEELIGRVEGVAKK